MITSKDVHFLYKSMYHQVCHSGLSGILFHSERFRTSRNDKKKNLIIFFLIITFCILLFSLNASASENIKVLILNDAYNKIPAKNERIEKLGSMKGDLLVMGSHYTGNIDIWRGDKGLYIINELPLEDYIKDVVAVEVGQDWEMEALKAQAVISRTYAIYQKRMNGDSVYHIASSVIHQVYKGNKPNVRVAYAVKETSDEVLTFNGRLIEAFYHSTCGGKTEFSEEVFGKSYPYLTSQESKCEISPYWNWQRVFQFEEIEKALNISKIKGISIKSYTSSKRIKQLNIATDSGTTVINATDLRKALGWSTLPSTNFRITTNGNSVVFEGKGYGHGVGLCQWCTLNMAREGKNYKEILSFFYPGTIIQLYEDH